MIGFVLGGAAVLGVRRLGRRVGGAHAGRPTSGYPTPPTVWAVPILVVNGTEPPLQVPICRFERVVVDPAVSHNGHKPKVIADFAREGIFGIGAATAGEGMNIYRPPGWTKFLISSYHRDGGEEDAQAVDINGDGAPDIVIGGLDNELVWLQNPLPRATILTGVLGHCTESASCQAMTLWWLTWTATAKRT